MQKEFIFKARARLLLQLGDQLIKDGVIALTELIKNSYDADASIVNVEMINIQEEGEDSLFAKDQQIIITDNGTGMDLNIIENVWLQLGSDYKEKKFLRSEVTEKFKRLPLGEKGIGRLGVHKLGNQIELITKSQNGKEIVVNIDWRIFNNTTFLEDVPITVMEREPEYFLENTGTKIIIKDLKTKWTKENIKEIFHAINSLSSPFQKVNNFQFNFSINNKNWVEDIIKFDTIIPYSLFHFKGTIEGDKITEFEYTFKPWDMFSKKMDSRKVSLSDINSNMVYNNGKSVIDLNKYQIGKIEIEGYVFDRDAEFIKYITNKAEFKKYLDVNGGFRVYRDNVRIYNYGEPGNDWLKLDISRVNMPVKKISNNIVLGMINLDRKNSHSLIEKTNREGFIENEAYHDFVRALMFFINQVELYRYIDKGNFKSVIGLGAKTKELVTSNIDSLKEIVETKIENEKIKDEIKTCVNRIEKEYMITKRTLLEASSSGMNLSLVIHEVEKSINYLIQSIEIDKDLELAKKLSQQLSNSIDLYNNLLKKGEKETGSLDKVLLEIEKILKLRKRRHNLEFDIDYSTLANKRISFPKKYLSNILLNIIDNSIAWLKYSRKENKKIGITITDAIPNHLTIVVFDNGCGFSISEEEAKRIFVTTKPFGEGVGLGLFVVDQLLSQYEGKLVIDDLPALIEIPSEYAEGAAVGIAFREVPVNEDK